MRVPPTRRPAAATTVVLCLTALAAGTLAHRSTRTAEAAEGGARSCTSAGCHESVARGSYVHGPAGSGDCDACHQALAPGAAADPRRKETHRFRLAADGAALCRECHDEKWMGRLAAAHRPVADGRCTACHDPHAAPHPKLLKARPPGLCAACHEQGKGRRVSPHAPVAAAESCATCHAPHVANGPSLLAAKTAEAACLECHDEGPASAAGRIAASVRAAKHGPVRVGGCGLCHDPHGGADRAILRATEAETCLGCHGPSVAAADPPEEGSPSGFCDGQRNLHAVHRASPGAARCSSCHDPHVTDGARPHYLRATVAAGDKRVPLPFAATAGGGRCGGACHAPRAYRRESP